jgi:hypothetical protein
VWADLSQLAVLQASMPSKILVFKELNLALAERVAKLTPDSNLIEKTRALNRLSSAQLLVNKRSAAASTAKKVSNLCRDIIYRFANHLNDPDIASLLMVSASTLMRTNYDEDFVAELAKKCADIYYELHRQQPEVFLPAYGKALRVLSRSQTLVKENIYAKINAEESVSVFKYLNINKPNIYLNGLIRSLHQLVNVCISESDHKSALEPAKEAVNLSRKISVNFRGLLVDSLIHLTQIYVTIGPQGLAKKTATELFDLVKELNIKHEDTFKTETIHAHDFLACCTKDAVERLPLIRRAIIIFIQEFLGHVQFPDYRSELQRLLRIYFTTCQEANQPPDEELLKPLPPFLINRHGSALIISKPD